MAVIHSIYSMRHCMKAMWVNFVELDESTADDIRNREELAMINFVMYNDILKK